MTQQRSRARLRHEHAVAWGTKELRQATAAVTAKTGRPASGSTGRGCWGFSAKTGGDPAEPAVPSGPQFPPAERQ
jgi:hypothetical protein